MIAKPSPSTIFPFGRYSEGEYLQWLDHKEVIVVGPAGYLRGQNQGALIDAHQVVVRINHALPIVYPEDYGSRTDVLYHILSRRNAKDKKRPIGREEILLWQKEGIDWLVCRHSKLSNRVADMGPVIDGAFPWICMSYTFYSDLKRSIGEKAPNTGIAAIMHILSTKVKSLTVVGFDLYATGVYQGYGDIFDNEEARKINDKWHSERAQREYLKSVIQRDNRIIIDDHLRRVLQL